MTRLKLTDAQAIVAAAMTFAREAKLKPLAITVLDDRGAQKAFAAEDGVSLRRADIAHAKAYGAISLGVGSRALFQRAQEQPYFVTAAGQMLGGALVPVPGGVLIYSADTLVGAVGISGDTSDNDEAAALAGIGAAGLRGEAG